MRYVLIMLLVITSGSSAVLSGLNNPQNDLYQSRLEISTDKPHYLPGEPVAVRFRVINNTGGDISLYKGSTVGHGYLQVFIASGGGPFKQYIGPRWGLDDSITKEPRMTLKRGKEFQTEASILWNHAPEVSHLNEEAAERASEGRIRTHYALPEPGIYSLKAKLFDPGTRSFVESEPVQINVQTPAGAELTLWNLIKGDEALAYFIQTGSTKYRYDDKKTKQLIDFVEGLLSSYPDSHYSAAINRSLTKYRAQLEKIYGTAKQQ